MSIFVPAPMRREREGVWVVARVTVVGMAMGALPILERAGVEVEKARAAAKAGRRRRGAGVNMVVGLSGREAAGAVGWWLRLRSEAWQGVI